MEVTEQQDLSVSEPALSGQSDEVVSQDSGNSGGSNTYDLGGEQVTAEQIQEWKKGYMMQSDYTRKAQEIAKLRDEVRPYQELGNYLKQNPDKAQTIYKYLNGEPIENQNVNPQEMKIQQLERTMQNLILENSKKDALNRIERIKSDSKYDGLFNDPAMEELLLAKALQTGDLDLGNTAEAIHKKILDLKTNVKLETEKQIQKNLQSPTRKGTTGKGTVEPPKGFDPSKAASKELESRALEMLS